MRLTKTGILLSMFMFSNIVYGPTLLKAEQTATMTPESKIAEAAKIFNTGNNLSERLSKSLHEARREKDIIKVTCLHDKLTQVNANLRTTTQRTKALLEAKQMNDVGRTNHEFTVLSVLSQKFNLLDQEANLCVGQDFFEPETSQVVTDSAAVDIPHDQIMPMEISMNLQPSSPSVSAVNAPPPINDTEAVPTKSDIPPSGIQSTMPPWVNSR